MNYRPLGKTGLRVSQISFGASSLGGVFHEVHEDESIRAVRVALDAGINYIDIVHLHDIKYQDGAHAEGLVETGPHPQALR